MNKDIKNNTELYELIHYAQNKLSDKQRNEIERAFERDKFLEEAYNGMAKYKASEILSDLHSVDFVHGRKKKVVEAKIVYFSVLLMAIVGIVYFFTVKNELFKKQPAPTVNEPQELFAVDDDTVLDVSVFSDTNTVLAVDTSSIISSNAIQHEKSIRKTIRPDNKETKTHEKLKINTSTQDGLKVEDTLPIGKMKSRTISNVKHSDDQDITKPTSILQNDNEEKIETELQTLQSNVKKTENDSIALQTHDAMPVGGIKEFNRYVKQNIRYPESDSEQIIREVEVSFEIDGYGRPHKFNVNRAPENSDFQNEAIRLLHEGPKWYPAINKGDTISSRASVQILFTPDSI